MKNRTRKSAAGLMAELEKDPTFLDQQRKRQEERRTQEQRLARAEAPIVEALREAGVSVASVWDFVNAVKADTKSLPILLDHLQRPYPEPVREGIARAMAVPGAKFAWPVLVTLYQHEGDRRAQDGLAVALSNIADDEVLDELVELARDPRHGESRLLLLSALERLGNSRARKALSDLGADPVLHKEVQRILRRLKRTRRRGVETESTG
jgi:HEAT repeat protein